MIRNDSEVITDSLFVSLFPVYSDLADQSVICEILEYVLVILKSHAVGFTSKKKLTL